MRVFSTIFAFAVLVISCGQPEARKPIVRKTSSFMTESIERNKVLTQVENEILLQKMNTDSIHQYLNSEQGFWYYHLVKDDSDKAYPMTGDVVYYSYEIRNLADEVIFSKDEIGTKSYFVDKEELISGLQDGLKLMRSGDKVVFLFPSHKAFGYTGSDRIESNQPLIYEVELIRINKKNENEKN